VKCYQEIKHTKEHTAGHLGARQNVTSHHITPTSTHNTPMHSDCIFHLEVLFNIRVRHAVRCEPEPRAVFYDRMGVNPHIQLAAVAPVYAQLVAGEEYGGVRALLEVH
jgi:hypothetical protein